MSTSKEALLSKLLQPASAGSSAPSSFLIQEVNPDPDTTETVKPVTQSTKTEVKINGAKEAEDNQPSIMEMMMAAQREAKAEKDKSMSVEAATKGLGGGFKKGFFGGGGGGGDKKKSVSSTNTAKQSTSAQMLPTSNSSKSDIVEVKKGDKDGKKNSSSSLVFDDVQKAMEEDQHPLLKQLKQTDWMTPDLVSKFQSSDVLTRGFRDPKCMAAIQMMQQDPEGAMRKCQGDPVVTAFLQEFGRLMAGHFEALGNSGSPGAGAGAGSSSGACSSGAGSSKPSGAAAATSGIASLNLGSAGSGSGSGSGSGGSGGSVPDGGVGKIQEIGPLHAKVLQQQAQQSKTTSSSTSTNKDIVVKTSSSNNNNSSSSGSSGSGSKNRGTAAAPALSEEERVQQILQDEELRSMLMDPALQAILLECGDPAKFQQHMRNPETARKIIKLQKSGLVGTAR